MKTVTFLDQDDLDGLQRGRPLIVQSEEGSDVELRFDDTLSDEVYTLKDAPKTRSNGKGRLKCKVCGATAGATGKPFKGQAGLTIHMTSHKK